MLSCLSLENHVGFNKEEIIMWNTQNRKEIGDSHGNHHVYYHQENKEGLIEIQGQMLQTNCTSTNLPCNTMEYDDFVTDEDEFESDCEEEEGEEVDGWVEEPESPANLLAFAATATNDIQHFFKRNQGSEDFCDVYEDRFKSIKSGRERYYADLLAEIGSERKHERFKQPTAKCHHVTSIANHHTITTPSGKTVRCHLPHQGLLDVNFGLGPFQELFDSVLRKSLIQESYQEPLVSNTCTNNKMTISDESVLHKFPEAICWEEPKHHQTLDFEDLLADWTTDHSGYDV